MSIVGVGHAAVTPVPTAKSATAAPEYKFVAKTGSVGPGAAQITAQQYGSKDAAEAKPAPQRSSVNNQPLNSSGRGQIVNILA